MAEDHRRVEPRSIVGTGMATDPARLEQIGQDAARRERAWREQPPEAFGAILDRAPARADLADAVTPDRRRQPPADANDDDNEAASPPLTPPPTTTTTPPARPERLSPRAPDPRAALLHARLAAKPSSSTTSPKTTAPKSVETPPTASVAPPPRGTR